ncbi:uncharacterized protein K452DRAFT_315852 [Aplosporella prunicola CBS 121167]|uniref:Homeobox domain-containing protein n=1 Tax=Aplosporella prunicola CBS 121167 TaxID=1176127 RepID=A0A6A6BNK2_9PEZI|nr:uncharacterized protein K452DRAFT_315852 [Aplosporella prunicola CBS 121167]KAF2145656.1 hypothetical protein K452DRAFT_315852 [Aplosporella prunicola CBS 121167]
MFAPPHPPPPPYPSSASDPTHAPQMSAPPAHPVVQDVKPRLTKEQHDILEAHFQQQHKPTTSTKKGFADALGVPLDKINNWFQNRRAKVKQDLKKQMSQYNMNVNMLQQMPAHAQMQPPQGLPQAQPPPQIQNPPQPQLQTFFHGTTDMNPSSLPGNGFAVPPQDMVPVQVPSAQDFTHHGHGLQSISESAQPTASYKEMMHSLARAGYPIDPSHASAFPHGLPVNDPYMSFDPSALSQPIPEEPQFAYSDFPGSSNPFSDAPFDFGADHLDFNALATSAPTSLTADNNRGSVSTEASPYSNNHATPPAGGSSTSAATVQAGWPDDPLASQYTQREESQDPLSSNMAGTQMSNSQWMPQPFRAPMYQQSNASSQTLMSSGPDPSDPQMLQISQADFSQPFTFADEAFNRRDSPAAALAHSMSNVEIQGPTSDAEFKQPDQPSSIAARRQRPRPAALGTASLRSQSYSAGMPTSPGSNHNLKADQTLRRIRSTGLVNGRIQKVNPGSAQRSPMHLSFAEAAASPKFALQTTGYAGGSMNGPMTTGSLAPPTPLTPNEVGRFPSWQQSPAAGNRSNANTAGDYTSAPGSGVVYSMAPTSAACFSSAASPPETPLNPAQSIYSHRARISNGSIFRDTPPQSAPATQQSFSRSAFVPPPPPPPPPPPMTEEPAPMDDPSIIQHQSQRRPSLPETGFSQGYELPLQFEVPMVNAEGELQMAHPMQFAQDPSMFQKQHPMSFAQDAGSIMAGPMHSSMTMQPELYVHEYAPPGQGPSQGQFAARQQQQQQQQHMQQQMQLLQQQQRQDMQPKSYIFANQTPGDFKA